MLAVGLDEEHAGILCPAGEQVPEFNLDTGMNMEFRLFDASNCWTLRV